jgi:hypothetical protein
MNATSEHIRTMTRGLTAALFSLALASTAGAVPPPPATSLNTCQSTVRTAAKTYVQNYVNAVGTCLQAVASKVVKYNAPVNSIVASSCVLQFRYLSDSRALGRSYPEKLTKAINAKCVPGGNNTHAVADILGPGAGVSEPLNAQDINAWCARFGGDGSVDSVAEWLSCIETSQTCAARAAVSTQYPRALEWLAAVKPVMQALTPPATDPNKITDAVAGLDAAAAAIDGPNGDGQPSLLCPLPGVCGNAVVEAGEQCDGANLGGQTCEGLGYTLGGTLACTASCGFSVSGCAGVRLPASGQTTSYGTGSDGDVEAGATLSYTDNGDGTVTDNNTGLMWEKKSDDGSIHDKDNKYTWGMISSPYTMNGTMVTTFLNTLNDVAGGGASCFAGHCDWRIPNVKELQSIVDYEIPYPGPTVNAAFNTSCAASCTALTCSCTKEREYWSSTRYGGSPDSAWIVRLHGRAWCGSPGLLRAA